jgi:dTDP-4-dehydrorhamnose reductase
MKILLIGKTGQLGGDILRQNSKHEICAPSRDVLEVTSKQSIEHFIKELKPEVVINTAAFHNVPLCEIECDKAFQVNCVAVRNLALACREADALFVTFSSDYVFDGEKRTPYLEDDKPAPLQMYGISRVAGEYAALSAAQGNSVVIRSCGLYGASGAKSKGGNFVDKRIQDARELSVLEMSSEQIVCPTYTGDLSRAVLQLIDHPRLKPGVYHLVNKGECSWYEFTSAIFEIMNFNVEVLPVDRGGMSGGMRRPLYSVLANSRAQALGIELPHWRDGLERYLGEKYGCRAAAAGDAL